MIDKAVLCIKGRRIADCFGLCLISLIVSALHVCIYRQTINNLSGINEICQGYSKDIASQDKEYWARSMKKLVQKSFSTIFLLCFMSINIIYLLFFQLSKVDFSLQAATHMSARTRLIICLYTILCVFMLNFDLVM